ncbi:MAG: GntR family transcriptional regulator [Phycisphaerales bacterium]|nr:GntR family transcriptional regulator [Phycisphaerales bacterium]
MKLIDQSTVPPDAKSRKIKSSHRDRAYGVIRRSILLGHLKRGVRVNERVLAEQLGISRMPVREALLCLHGEGLIRKSKCGLQVTKLTPQETGYQKEFRAIVECAAVRLAGQRITPAEIERLREVIAEQEILETAKDMQAFGESDLLFHQLLLKASRNPFLTRLSGTLGMGLVVGGSEPCKATVEMHAQILDAVAKGDADEAEKQMYKHVIEDSTYSQDTACADEDPE